MRTSIKTLLTLAMGAATTLSLAAQTPKSFASSGSSTNVTSSAHAKPLPKVNGKDPKKDIDDDGIPAQLITAHVVSGTYTVDGVVAKVRMNYDIENTGYLYFFCPGVGTAVVSLVKTTDSQFVPAAFSGNTLRFTAGGHQFELSSDAPLTGNPKAKIDAYVRLDRSAQNIDRYPIVGFGMRPMAPYTWPASKHDPTPQVAQNRLVEPPRVPRNLLPRYDDWSTSTTVVAAAKSDKPEPARTAAAEPSEK